MGSVEEMLENARYGLQFTPYLKIKLDDDLQKSIRILEAFHAQSLGKQVSLDANSSWGPDVTLAFLAYLAQKEESFRRYVLMVEQPFDISYVPGTDAELDAKWQSVRQQFVALGVDLYGDESVSDATDVALLANSVTGVNIKLEKVGGLREAIRTIRFAREKGLKVWIVEMVVSALGNSVAAQLLVFGDWGDLDGSLLTIPELYDGGIAWENGFITYEQLSGYGVRSLK